MESDGPEHPDIAGAVMVTAAWTGTARTKPRASANRVSKLAFLGERSDTGVLLGVDADCCLLQGAHPGQTMRHPHRWVNHPQMGQGLAIYITLSDG
jgi:hypothetical protein